MSWFRLDDHGAFHAKGLAAGNEAYGAWCRAGQWSSAHGTDGEIPKHVAAQIAPPRIWARLVSVKLLDQNPTKNDSFFIHDFLEYNPSRESVEERRRVRAANGSLGGKRRVLNNSAKQTLEQLPSKDSSNTQAGGDAVLDPRSNPRPVPSRPDPNKIPPTPNGGEEKSVHDDSDLEAIRLKLCSMRKPMCYLAAVRAEERFYSPVVGGKITLAQALTAIDEAAVKLGSDLASAHPNNRQAMVALERHVGGFINNANQYRQHSCGRPPEAQKQYEPRRGPMPKPFTLDPEPFNS